MPTRPARSSAPSPALRPTVARWRKCRRQVRAGADHGRAARRPPRLWSARPSATRDRVVVSIFVNPTQFAPHEDLASYPRTWDADVAALAGMRVDLIWAPTRRRNVSGRLRHPRSIRTAPRRPAWRTPSARTSSAASPPWSPSCCFRSAGLRHVRRKGLPATQGRHRDGARPRYARQDRRCADGAREGWPRHVVAQCLPVARTSERSRPALHRTLKECAARIARGERSARKCSTQAARRSKPPVLRSTISKRAMPRRLRRSRRDRRADASAGGGQARPHAADRQHRGLTAAGCSSEQAEFAQLAAQRLGHVLGAARDAVEIGRRILGIEIAPALERALGPRLDRDHLGIEHQPAAADARLVDEGPDVDSFSRHRTSPRITQ